MPGLGWVTEWEERREPCWLGSPAAQGFQFFLTASIQFSALSRTRADPRNGEKGILPSPRVTKGHTHSGTWLLSSGSSTYLLWLKSLSQTVA